MALTYTTFVSSIANLLPVSISDSGFQTVLPNIIDDAEQRLYTELDLLYTNTRDNSGAFTAGARTFAIPNPSSGVWVVFSEFNVITPVGTTDPELGTRNPMLPISNEMLNTLWPSVAGSTVPEKFSMLNPTDIIVGPWPDAAYQVEAVGEIRPNPLSSSNVTTILSVYFPQLMIAAGMVFACGYQKNFGAMVDDPKSGITWEAHLQTLMAGTDKEESRKVFFAEGWSSQEPSKIVTPPRT
jgi:hypothetical protein